MTRLPLRLIKHPAFHTIGASLGRDPGVRRWVFVVGCYNSGTTLLDTLLSGHPDVCGLPAEGVRLTDALPRPEDFGWTRMWARCADEMRIPDGAEAEARARRIRRQWSMVLPRSARVAVEKSVSNTARMPFFDAHFPDAHFVYILRDGYAVSEGIRRKAVPARWGRSDLPDGYPIEWCAAQWLTSATVAEEVAPRLRRFHAVTYEALTRDPVQVMAGVTDFLGLSPLPSASVLGEWTVQGQSNPIENYNEQSIQRLTDREIDAINDVAGSTLQRLGYSRPAR